MAKKNTKMFSDFLTSVSPTCELVIPYNFEEQTFEVEVKNYMSIDEKRDFIERVANSCFDEDSEYHPEMRDAVFQITILQMLTNVPVFITKVDEVDDFGEKTGQKVETINIDKTYDLCRCLDLYAKADDIFRSLYEELKHYVAERIVFKQQRTLMGEKKMLDKTRAEMEDGIALINSIGETLNETMRESFSQGDIIKATNELAKRMDSMSDKELLESILGK